jgi:small subunit ribosomal protein S8
MMTDPIADMLTRIRNAIMVKDPSVRMPHSRVKAGVAEVLKREGYIQDLEVVERQGKKELLLHLRYARDQRPVIEGMERVSRPGRRVYVDTRKMPSIRAGLGIAILTTSKGIMTDAEARKAGIGGEVICNVW